MAKGCQVTSLSNNALHVPCIAENVRVKKIPLAVGQRFHRMNVNGSNKTVLHTTNYT